MKAKKFIQSIWYPLIVLSFSARVAFADSTLSELEEDILSVLESVVPILVGLAVVFFLWAAFKYMRLAQSDEDRAQARGLMVYGIVAILVMVSIWGIIEVLGDILDLDDDETIEDLEEIIFQP